MELPFDITTVGDIIVKETNFTANPNENASLIALNTLIQTTTDSYVDILQLYGPKRDPLYVVIPITFVYMLIFVTGG